MTRILEIPTMFSDILLCSLNKVRLPQVRVHLIVQSMSIVTAPAAAFIR